MELLIKNARVVDASKDFQGDVYIRNGVIDELGINLKKDCKVIQANGKVLMPSFVDLHAHFRDPGLTYKEDIHSGSKAAVKGGYTMVNLMPNTNPVCSSMDIVNQVTEKAQEIGLVDVNQTVSITKDLKGEDISHLATIEPEVKFISDDGKGVFDTKIMLEAMHKAKEKNITVLSHAEFDQVSKVDTRLAEDLMTFRDIALVKTTNCRLHLTHVSTQEAIKQIIDSKKKGYKVTCDVTPHHIALTNEVNYKVNPPLRMEKDVESLISAIKQGYVDAIATDHAPHSKEDKEKGACGISGIETSFAICYSTLVKEGHINLNKLSEIMSKNPAKIMSINKGEITIGMDGDLVLVDLDKKYKIKSSDFESKGKNSPFENKEVNGQILMTIKGGKVVYSI